MSSANDPELGSLLVLIVAGNETERADAARAIGNSGARNEAIIRCLLSALDDESEGVRIQTVAAIGKLRVESSARRVGALLHERAFYVRETAAKALAMLGKEGFETLCTAVVDPDSQTRESAAIGLGHCESMLAVGFLMPALADTDRRVRCSAIEALAKLRSEAAVDQLVNILQRTDEDDMVLDSAADALGRIGGPKTCVLLQRLIAGEDQRARQWAEFAMNELRAWKST